MFAARVGQGIPMSVDLRTEINDAENSNEWLTDGAQLGNTSLSGLFYQGAAAISVQHSNADEATYAIQDSGGTNLNLDLSGHTVYVIVKHNLGDSYTNGGIQIMLGDGTDRIGYDVGGNDAVGLPLTPFFNVFKLDTDQSQATPGSFTTFAGSEANLTYTAITQVGYGSLQPSKAQGNVANTFIYHQNGNAGLEISGGTSGTPETTADVVGDDETNGWGMISNPVGDQYGFIAPVAFGDVTSAGTVDCYFTTSDEAWVLYGDNGGGRVVDYPNMIVYVGQASAATTELRLTNITMTCVGTPSRWTHTAITHDAIADVARYDNCVFTNMGQFFGKTAGTWNATNYEYNGCTFNNSGPMLPRGHTLTNCVFNGTQGNLPTGFNDNNIALFFTQDESGRSDHSDLTFNSGGTGHAIELRPTGAGPFTYNFDNFQFNGYASDAGTATDRAVYVNPVTSSADITINVLNGGNTPSIRTAAGYTGTVTIVQTVPITITVQDVDGNPIQGARVFLETTPGGVDVISYGTTNASGVVSTTFGGTTPVDVVGYVRKGTGSPVYKAANINDSIASGTGLSATITLVADE